jgi:hypothetical protein
MSMGELVALAVVFLPATFLCKLAVKNLLGTPRALVSERVPAHETCR